MNKKCYIGVDVGKSGAALAIYEYGDKDWYGIEWVSLNSPPKEINEWFIKWKTHAVACGIEKVHSMPGQGVKSTFSFGQSFGSCINAANLLDIEPEFIPPQTWQKFYGLCGGFKNKTEKKNAHKAKCDELFNLDFSVSHRIADAMLIAWYFKLKYEGEI